MPNSVRGPTAQSSKDLESFERSSNSAIIPCSWETNPKGALPDATCPSRKAMEAPISENSMLLLLAERRYCMSLLVLHCLQQSHGVGANESSCGGGQLDDDMPFRRDLRRGKKQYEHKHRYIMSNRGISVSYRFKDRTNCAVISGTFYILQLIHIILHGRRV